jgi:hypothetical protein
VLFGETPNELDASPFSSEEHARVKRKLLGVKSHRPRTERVPDEKRIIFNDHVYSARSRECYRRVGSRIKMARGSSVMIPRKSALPHFFIDANRVHALG